MIKIIPYTLDFYEQVAALLRETGGVSFREADSRDATKRYLQRNPGLSFLAICDEQLVGCAICGHDGRRGYLQHVAVAPEFRNRGIAHKLVRKCLEELQSLGIVKAHLDVFLENIPAQNYWEHQGWKKRNDIIRYSFNSSKNSNS